MDINETFCDARVLLNAHYTQLRLSYWIICGLTKGQMSLEILDVHVHFNFF